MPTQDDIHIVTSQLPTNQRILLAFIAKKEEFDQTKNKNPMFKAAMSITTEQILPTYARAKIPTKQANKISQDMMQHYRSMQKLMKIKKEKREIGRAKERIEAFKKRLQETSACWPKDVWSRLSNTEDSIFFINAEISLCINNLAGKDNITHKLEMRPQKKKRSSGQT